MHRLTMISLKSSGRLSRWNLSSSHSSRMLITRLTSLEKWFKQRSRSLCSFSIILTKHVARIRVALVASMANQWEWDRKLKACALNWLTYSKSSSLSSAELKKSFQSKTWSLQRPNQKQQKVTKQPIKLRLAWPIYKLSLNRQSSELSKCSVVVEGLERAQTQD